MIATRFAPSPTGLLHLGHAYSAMVAHDAARALGGAYLLRIDDLDTARVRPAYRQAIAADLAWLGLAPDAPPLLQSERIAAYAGTLAQLVDAGLAYRCFCTRAEIAGSIAAPHGPDGPVYPGNCRASDPAAASDRADGGAPFAWRLDVARALAQAGSLHWRDADAGDVVARPALFGDIVLARRDGAFAYHLASTIDDAAQRVSHVVRGRDLFAATHVHRLLQALLDLPTPSYRHHPLVGDAGGRRLAKRHDAASLASLRAAGIEPETLLDAFRHGRLPLGYRWVEP